MATLWGCILFHKITFRGPLRSRKFKCFKINILDLVYNLIMVIIFMIANIIKIHVATKGPYTLYP